MIRKCTENDHGQIMGLVSQEPALNLFIIADIENLGYASNDQEVWGDFVDGDLRGVMLRYYANYLVYEPSDSKPVFVNKLLEATRPNFFSGKQDIVKRYVGHIPFRKTRSQFFLELTANTFQSCETTVTGIRRARIGDAEQLFALRCQIDEFADFRGTLEDARRRLEGERRTYVLERDGRIVSSVCVAAESSSAAMVGGVMTDPEYRKRGYASACMTVLCTELLKEGKTACLFYDNVGAGQIYRRLGFRDIGKWMMCIR